MIFKHVLLDINDTNCYILGCEETHECLLIDPGEYHRDIADYVRRHNLEIRYIAVTHAHYDHASGLEDILRAFGGKVLVFQPGYFTRAQKISEGDSIPFGRHTARVLHTPGHTPDSISLRCGNMVFTGDALFCGSVGGTASRDTLDEEIRHIRRAILPLGDSVEVYPGHGPPTTVGIERLFNPYLI